MELKDKLKLITEFVGPEFHNKLCYREFGNVDYSEVEGYYNSSWDWFMPVWFKFRDLTFPKPLDTDPPMTKHEKNFVKHEHRNYKRRISNAIWSNNDPSYAVNELIEGIDWYNKLKNK